MLGKLIKYDFKSMLRYFVPLWIVFLAVALINRFAVRIPDFGVSGATSIIMNLLMLLYVALIIAINVIGIVLVIQRFYNGLLKEEGYLMFTLPVKTWQNVCAKGITATALIFANGIVSLISVGILVAGEGIIDSLREVFDWLSANGLNAGLMITLVVILTLVTILVSIYHIYAAMALGHLANKRRVSMSVVAYIGTSFALSAIGSVVIAILEPLGVGDWLNNMIESFKLDTGAVGAIIIIFAVLIVIELIQLAAFYVVTERILTKRLNLE